MLIGFSGFEDDQVQDLTCPIGYSINAVNVNGKDAVWCQNAQGARVSATATPSTTAAVVVPASAGGLGVIGWSFLAALGLLVGAALLSPKRGSW